MEWLDTENLKFHVSRFNRLMHTIVRMVRLFPVHPPPSNVYGTTNLVYQVYDSEDIKIIQTLSLPSILQTEIHIHVE